MKLKLLMLLKPKYKQILSEGSENHRYRYLTIHTANENTRIIEVSMFYFLAARFSTNRISLHM